MTVEEIAVLIGTATPLIIAFGAGVFAVVKWVVDLKSSSKDTEAEVTQGQTVPVDGLNDYLSARLERLEEEVEAFRDALVRSGIDPKKVLVDAGLEE